MNLARDKAAEKMVRCDDFGYGLGRCLFDGCVRAILWRYQNGVILISVWGADDYGMERCYFPEQKVEADEAWLLIDHGVTIDGLKALGFWTA